MDLVQYAARACPPLSLDNIASYIPKDEKSDSEDGKQNTPVPIKLRMLTLYL